MANWGGCTGPHFGVQYLGFTQHLLCLERRCVNWFGVKFPISPRVKISYFGPISQHWTMFTLWKKWQYWIYLYLESKLLLKEISFDTLYSVDVENNQISGFWNSAPLLLHPIPYQWIPGWSRNNMSGWLSGAHSRDRVSVSVSPEVLIPTSPDTRYLTLTIWYLWPAWYLEKWWHLSKQVFPRQTLMLMKII